MPACTTRSDYIAPSIDLSVAFHRSEPDEPWLYAQASAPSASGGLVACESRVWARGGTLLAVGAGQLLCRPGHPSSTPPSPFVASETHNLCGPGRNAWLASGVEDRHTAGLYLEMTDLPLDAYAGERVPAVLALPGAERATWWRNVHRDRDDLPRVLPEFDHLGVYEVGEEFRAAGPRPGVSGAPLPSIPAPRTGRADGPAHDRAVARADLAEGARAGPRNFATGPTSCTSATSPRPPCPATP